MSRLWSAALLAGCMLVPLQHSHAIAQPQRAAPVSSGAALQVLFLYNFAKFVSWPEHVFASPQAPITICIYGEKPNEIRQAVGELDGKLAQGREVRTRRSVTLSELGSCQVIFVAGSERRWMSEILKIAQSASALTVSDMEGFVDVGGGIGLFEENQKIRFECNVESTQAAHLKLGAQLLKLAKGVKGQGSRN